MRKNYFLTLAFILMSALWTTASAVVWEAGTEAKTTFADGDLIVMQASEEYGANAGAYLAGSAFTTTVVEDNVIKLCATGKTGTLAKVPTFRLKQVSTGKFLKVYGDAISWGDSLSATELEICVAGETRTVVVPKDADGYSEQRTGIAPEAYKSSDIYFVAPADANDLTKGYYMLAKYGADLLFWGYSDTSAWNIFSVTSRVDYVTELNNLIAYYDGLKITFPIGTAPGCYPEAAVTRYQTAYNAAAAGAEQTLTNEQYLALENELKAARANVDSLANPMQEGYYYFRNAYPNFVNSQGHYKGMYASGSALMWANIDSTSAKYMFKVTKEGDGIYSIQNFGTTKYVGAAPGTMTDTYVQPQVFTSLGNGQFNILKSGGSPYHPLGHSGGAGKSGSITTYGGGVNTGSAWYLDPVPESMRTAAEAAAVQDRYNTAYTDLLASAKKVYKAAVIYPELVTNSNDKNDGTSQYISNMKETSEGTYAALIDNNTSSYFHSSWGNPGTKKHFLQADLLKAYENIRINTVRRITNQNNRPKQITIFGTNDATIAADLDMSNIAKWDSLTQLTKLPSKAADGDEYHSPKVSFPKAYRYVRFVVDSTSNNTLFFTYSEFHITTGDIDETRSQYSRLGNLYTNLGVAIDTANAVVARAQNITTDQRAALQSAYDAYMASYIDSTRLTSLITADTILIKGAEEGTEIGQCAPGYLSMFQAAITAARSFNYFTATRPEFDGAVGMLKTAEKAFLSGIVKPIANKWYYIVNRMGESQDKTRYGNAMYASDGSIGSVIKWGGAENKVLSDVAMGNPKYIWRFVATSDTTFAIQNMGTSYYVGTFPGLSSTAVKMTDAQPGYMIKYAGSGTFTLTSTASNATPLHAAAADNAVVSYNFTPGSASGWTFQGVGELDALTLQYAPNSIQAVCYPFAMGDVNGSTFGATVHMYKITSKTGADGAATGINLTEVKSVDAGVPFILQVGDYTKFDAKDDSTKIAVVNPLIIADADIVTAPAKANGMVGNFTTYSFTAKGLGLIESSVFRVTGTAKEFVAANTAVINEAAIVADATAKIDFTLPTGSGQGTLNQIVSAASGNAVGDIYTVSGTRVAKGVKASEAIKSLPKGIYIINRSKVSVK